MKKTVATLIWFLIAGVTGILMGDFTTWFSIILLIVSFQYYWEVFYEEEIKRKNKKDRDE